MASSSSAKLLTDFVSHSSESENENESEDDAGQHHLPSQPLVDDAGEGTESDGSDDGGSERGQTLADSPGPSTTKSPKKKRKAKVLKATQEDEEDEDEDEEEEKATKKKAAAAKKKAAAAKKRAKAKKAAAAAKLSASGGVDVDGEDAGEEGSAPAKKRQRRANLEGVFLDDSAIANAVRMGPNKMFQSSGGKKTQAFAKFTYPGTQTHLRGLKRCQNMIEPLTPISNCVQSDNGTSKLLLARASGHSPLVALIGGRKVDDTVSGLPQGQVLRHKWPTSKRSQNNQTTKDLIAALTPANMLPLYRMKADEVTIATDELPFVAICVSSEGDLKTPTKKLFVSDLEDGQSVQFYLLSSELVIAISRLWFNYLSPYFYTRIRDSWNMRGVMDLEGPLLHWAGFVVLPPIHLRLNGYDYDCYNPGTKLNLFPAKELSTTSFEVQNKTETRL